MQTPGDTAARVRIRALLKLMALGGAVMLLAVFLSYVFSRPGETGDARLRVELTGIAPGEMRRLVWNDRRILVLHRDAALQQALGDATELVDPRGRWGQQPDGLERSWRSFRPEWLVVIGESTDLGCELDLVPPKAADGWSGGFVDRCRGGRYDAAGRVYAGQNARRNLPIPDHRFAGPDVLILGDS